jgi:membrane-bound metal-dependent hydrolase YbcI (DUF457 family)
MPSPIGHALAGLAIGLIGEPPRQPLDSRQPWPWRFVFLAAFFAALPDLDLALPKGFHRSFSHSFVAVAAVLIFVRAVTGEVTARARWRMSAMLAAAYASHLLLDWLGADTSRPAGLQLLWPWTHAHFMSGWDLFPQTERAWRDPEFLRMNLIAFVSEVALMGPVAAAAWAVRRRRRSRVQSSDQDSRRQPFAAATGTDGISGRPGPRAER